MTLKLLLVFALAATLAACAAAPSAQDASSTGPAAPGSLTPSLHGSFQTLTGYTAIH